MEKFDNDTQSEILCHENYKGETLIHYANVGNNISKFGFIKNLLVAKLCTTRDDYEFKF